MLHSRFFLFYLVGRFGQLIFYVKPIQAFSGETSPLSTFSSGLLKFLCPPSPLLLWGFWIESSSCLVLQVSWHICQGCTEIGRSLFEIAKNTKKTTMAQPLASQWVNPYVCVVIADEIFAAFSLFDCFVLVSIRDICHRLERHLCSVTRLKKNVWKWCEE